MPPLLQPVAHALVQARDDVAGAAAELTAEQLWQRPGGAASAGFHLGHLAGSLDRLFTYARGESLSDAQRANLAAEGQPGEPPAGPGQLVAALDEAVGRAIGQLRATPEDTLLDSREVGRQRLPSTVLGLLFHAAEHSSRHAGQFITTVKVVLGTWDEVGR